MTDSLMAALVAAGGAAVVVGAVFVVLAKVLADSLGRQFQHGLDRALEDYRDSLARRRESSSLFEEAEFGDYRAFWSALSRVRLAADHTWDDASTKNIDALRRALRLAEIELHNGALLFNQEDMQEMRHALHRFQEFLAGKNGLLELRRSGASPEELRVRVAENRELRENYLRRYRALRDEIRARIREALRPSSPLRPPHHV